MPQAFRQVTRSEEEPAPPLASARPSETAVILPIAGALNAAERYANERFSGRHFVGISDRQTAFLDNYYNRLDLAASINGIPELKSIAAPGVEKVNAFLRENGFPDVQLDPMDDPKAFSAASILDLLLKWAQAADRATIRRGGVEYPAIDWKDGVFVYTSPSHPYPIVEIATASKDKVYVTIAGGGVPSGEDLADYCAALKTGLRSSQEYKGLTMPMLSYDDRTDISWLVGMPITESEFFIAQALQQTRVRLNHLGVRVQSAVAIAMTRGMSMAKKKLVIDEPFLLWIERPALSVPLLAGYFAPDSWKDPGSLD